ncbi:hypothetical protein BYT27DRAFT_7263636 [Phlegmacium glaucopus]|nr:hypothetical protein BYT27DRAFT_7263636 [Phlegmacium glaucopus]
MNDSGRLGMGFLIPIVIPPYNRFWMSGCETRRKKRVKNVVNGYPICNNEFATVEKFEASSKVSYERLLLKMTEAKINGMQLHAWQDLESLTELSDENHVETEKKLHEDLDVKDPQIHDQLPKIEDLNNEYPRDTMKVFTDSE